MYFLLLFWGREEGCTCGFTQIPHEDTGPATWGQTEESFSISPGTVTRIGRLTQEKYSLYTDIPSDSYS